MVDGHQYTVAIDGYDVPADLLIAHGAVSEPVAIALAEGVRRRLGASVGVGVTGVAGPGGGTPAKPVGMVCMAVSSDTGSEVRTFNFPGDRQSIRGQATQAALDMVRQMPNGHEGLRSER